MDELLELMAGAVAALIAAGILLGISAYAGVVLLPLVALAVLPCAVIGMFAGATLGGLVRTAIIVAGVVVSFAADWQRGLFPHLSSLLPFAPIALGIATIAALWRGIRVGRFAHIGYHGDVPATLDCHIGSGWFCLAGAVGWLAIVGEYATLGYGILFPRDLPWPLLPALVVALSTVALAGFSYATARNVAWGRHRSR